ncbi:orotidine-5'-phosphate decarboxylase [Microvirga sp. W0021]|uniref:Orotidine 5'-phosphate decarboxylase n=1 Tax=Hohaiivirga grylli TaxID=3133970 RepID=A0ABV0BGH4_9HYPH
MNLSAARERLIVALDISSIDEARALVRKLGDEVVFYKIGYQLGYAGGFELARELIAVGKKVFLDLKLHDIGNTVEEGIRSIAQMGVTLATVHAYPQTMRAAVKGKAGSNLKVIAVTVLTSYDNNDFIEAGYSGTVSELVAKRAAQAKDIGIDGIVCAATEAGRVQEIIGTDKLIVTPGIRPAGSSADDQKRIVTPAMAIRSGSTHLVVGRPITAAADPVAAAKEIVAEIASAL